MRLKIYIIINLLLSISLFHAQRSPNHNKYFIFLDAKTKDIKITENDSIIYTNNFQNPKKIQKDNIPEFFDFYQYQFSINNKNYFVNCGGGVVLEYDNNTFKRIDQSFLHKNQFAASFFSYKNEIYLFGGYGLFTSKNILVKYDFKAREWFLIPYNSIERPNPGENFESILIGDNFYVFGGNHQKEVEIGEELNDPNILWRLNLKTKIWTKMGHANVKHIPTNHYNGINNFVVKNKLYIISLFYSAVIDIENNKITYYKSPIVITDERIIYNPKNNTINYLTTLSSNRKIVFTSIKLEDFFKEPLETETFYKEPFDFAKGITYLSFSLLLLLPFGLWKFTRSKKQKVLKPIKSDNKLTYSISQKEIYFNNNLLHDFTSLELAVLSFLFEHIEEYIPIHNINFIIEQEIATNSPNTILRKREAVTHLLKSKLSIILNIGYEDIILEQRNAQDRRIKEIKLNEKYFVVS